MFVSHVRLSVSESYQSACNFLICPFVDAFVRCREETSVFVISLRPSVRARETSRLIVVRFSLKLIFEYFFFEKFCLECSSFTKI